MNRHALYFLLGSAVFILGGAIAARYYYDYFVLMNGTGIVDELELREHLIMSIAIGAGVFLCSSGGYFLFQMVKQSRLRAFIAVALFGLWVVISEFVPVLFMMGDQLFWSDVYRGDRGWDLLFALFVTGPFLVGLFLIFITGLVICRYSHAKVRPVSPGALEHGR
jgi:hypothetical protein